MKRVWLTRVSHDGAWRCSGCATAPRFLDAAWTTDEVKPGQRIMPIGVVSTKFIYAGIVADWTAPPPSAAS